MVHGTFIHHRQNKDDRNASKHEIHGFIAFADIFMVPLPFKTLDKHSEQNHLRSEIL